MRSKKITNIKKKRILSQPKQKSAISSKTNKDINQITEIYNNVYDELFPQILIFSKTAFFEKLHKKVNDAISSGNSQDELQRILCIKLISKIKEDIAKKYDNDYKHLSTEYQNYLKNPQNYKYLTHFRRHCVKTDIFALHYCSSRKQGKFIEVKVKNKYNNKEEISYVICAECKFCYISNFILMICPPCNKKYYSNILNDNENPNIVPATWTKYHCGSLINQIMKCIKCRGILYLDLPTKQLICLNKKCNFSSKPESILWKCFICSKDFRSGAKIYNPLEFKILNKSIHYALLLKKKAAPKELPCKCEKDLSKLTFLHKEECKGELYKGMLIDKEIIVCSKCHSINFEEKFTWICPVCSIKFHLHTIAGCRPFSKKKYIINRNYNQSAKEISKKNKIKNKNKEKKEKNINNIHLLHKEKEMEMEKSERQLNDEQNSIENAFNKTSRIGTNFYKKFNHERNNDDNQNIIRLKKTNTTEKRNKQYSTLLDILQERKRSQSKLNQNDSNEDKIIEKNKLTNSTQHLHIRNAKNKINYRNKTCENYQKRDIITLKDNLKPYKNISNLIINDDNTTNNNNDDINNSNSMNKFDSMNKNNSNNNTNKDLYSNYITNNMNYKYNNTPKTEKKRIKVNKRYPYQFSPYITNESSNDNNRQKDIIKHLESTDFSTYKTLSSNDQKNNARSNILYNNSKTNNSSLFSHLNSFRHPSKMSIPYNNNDIKGYNLYKATNLNDQLTENTEQDIIIGLTNSSCKKNIDTFNSSLRISLFENISTLNEVNDYSKKDYYYNNKDLKREISEIYPRNKNSLSASRKEEEINNNNNYDNNSSAIKEEKQEIKDGEENINKVKENTQKSEESDNNEEIKDKFEEMPERFFRKKNVMESMKLNSNEVIFQNVLITQDKLDNLAKISNIPSFQETDYNYIRSIGEGSYGMVYLAENIQTSEQFALKKIVCRDYNELIKHKNELELIYSVKHEHILSLNGISFRYLDETTSAIYVLMELAQNDWNMEIKRRIIAKKFYKENELIDILNQIIEGLLFLQEKNIAHRDIKPQNILLFPNNVYKIADFGEAKNIKNISQQSTLRGSELYMSPSLYKGYKFNQKNVLHNPYKSDVFSLGYCFLYAICLNLKVLEAVRELTTMRSIISTINKYIVKNKYSDKLMNLLYKMINPNESERLDFEDLSIELDNF
jgi:hypothetical protein